MHPLFKFFTRLISFGFAVGSAMVAALALYTITLLPGLPSVEAIRQVPLNVPLRIYSSDKKLIAEYGDERRIPLTLDQAPPLLIDALLATEDHNFYHHTGVDFASVARALLSNIRNQSHTQGASTITMQVARNFFLSPEKTYVRKLREVLLTFNIERAITKDEIFELYLNKIFLGHRAYGFAVAAQVYYGEELGSLSVPEIAMLAGLPKSPSRDNPVSNPRRASERRDYVLKRLYDLGKIDKLSLETAQKAPVTANRHIAEVELRAPYIAEMTRKLLVEKLGNAAYQQGLNVTLTINSVYQEKANQALRQGLLDYDARHGYRGAAGKLDISGLDKSTIDDLVSQYPTSKELIPAVVLLSEQSGFTARTGNGVELAVKLAAMQWAKAYETPNSQGPNPTAADHVVQPGDVVYVVNDTDGSWRLSQMPEISGALVSLDSKTGAILALTGGFDYYLSKFNRAIQAERQPGSNIKPFIYSAALEHGFTLSSLVSGAPIVIEDNLEGIWRPENYSKKFFGPTRLRKAFSLSLNLVSVRLLRAVGIDAAIQHLSNFGFAPARLPRNLSLSLGSTTMTPLELARGYATFANGGVLTTPFFIDSIVDADGNAVTLPNDEVAGAVAPCAECNNENETATAAVAQPPNPQLLESKPAISPQNAFLITSILKQVILSGTGRRALALNRSDLAGKTGTTNNYRDAWFSGFNPDVTTTVFVGFDELSHLGHRESGAGAALPIWIDYMGTVLKDFPERLETIPERIITRLINKNSGELTTTNDPDGYIEYFLADTEPDDSGQPPVTKPTGTNPSDSDTLF